MQKAMPDEVIEVRNAILNAVIKTETVPKDYKIGIITLISKKWNPKECINDRDITLLSEVEKLYTRIIEHKIRKKLEKKTLEENQFGFRSNR